MQRKPPKPGQATASNHEHGPRGARRLRLPPNVRPLTTARLKLSGGHVDITLARSGSGAFLIFARPLGPVPCRKCVGLPLLMVRHTYSQQQAERRFTRMVDALAGGDVIEFLRRCKPSERIDAYFLGLLGFASFESALGAKLEREAHAGLERARAAGEITPSLHAAGCASIALRLMTRALAA